MHQSGDRALSTPAVRAYAKEKGVDINKVTGTGPNHRVTRDDIDSYATPKVAVKEPAKPTHKYQIAPLTGITEGD